MNLPFILLAIAAFVLAILAIVFIVLYTNKEEGAVVREPECPSEPTELESIVDFMKNNTLTYGEMKIPIGYNVAADYFSSIPKYSDANFKSSSNSERYNNLVAINNQIVGFSTYDAAVWAVCMTKYTDLFWQRKAGLFLSYLNFATDYPDQAGSLISPREKIATESVDPANVWVYNGVAATVTSSGALTAADNIGYHFRNLPSNGWRVNVPPSACSVGNLQFAAAGQNVKINPAVYPGCTDYNDGYSVVDQLYLTWSDYRPVTGENLWVLNAACHLFSALPNDYSTRALPYLCNRLVKTCLALEAYPSSGIPYYSPQRNNVGDWNVYQYSVENMASTISALINFANVTGFPTNVVDPQTQTAARLFAGRIAQRILDTHVVTDYEYDNKSTNQVQVIQGPSVNQGGIFNPSSNRVVGGAQANFPQSGLINGREYATDCTTWVINVMGDKIDDVKGAGTCFELYENCKRNTGYFEDGVCKGFGYSFNAEDNVHSSEWSIGGLFAARQMALYLYADDAAKVQTLETDISNFLEKLQQQTRSDMNVTGTGLNYCSQKDYPIVFGWLGQENVSMASSGWYVFWLEQFNPWRVDGSMRFCDFDLQSVALT